MNTRIKYRMNQKTAAHVIHTGSRFSRGFIEQRERSIILFLTTLLLVFIFAWFLSSKTDISSVKASSLENSYKYYTSVQVKQGDSLWSIANAYMTAECGDVSDYVDEIKELNHLNDDAIHAGEYILVPYYSLDYL